MHSNTYILLLIFCIFIFFNYKINYLQYEKFTAGTVDTTALSTLVQVATGLTTGGYTVPGNINITGTTTTNGILTNNGTLNNNGVINTNGIVSNAIINTNKNPIRFWTPDDGNHFITHTQGNRPFFKDVKNGIGICGWEGGILGSSNNGDRYALKWNSDQSIDINGDLRITGNLIVNGSIITNKNLEVLQGHIHYIGLRSGDPYWKPTQEIPVMPLNNVIRIGWYNNVTFWIDDQVAKNTPQGALGIGAGKLPWNSDRRIKTYIGEIQNTILSRLLKLNIFNFKYIDYDDQHIGFYADELQDAFPEYPQIIIGKRDAVTEAGTIIPQQVSFETVMLLFKAVQELAYENNKLKQSIYNLENNLNCRISKLEKLLSNNY